MPVLTENFLETPPTYEELDKLLEANGAWNVMSIVSADKPMKSGKMGSFIGIPDENNSFPILRCPSFYDCILMEDWMKQMFIEPLFKQFGFRCNIVKVQKYINGECGISKHCDKGIDLFPADPIFIFRINKNLDKTRSLCFCHKTNTSEETYKYDLQSNSLLRISYEENQQLLHYVPMEEENGSEESISFVFRNSGTFRNRDTNQIYGLGAKFNTYDERLASDLEPMSDARGTEEILEMYRIENTEVLPSVNYDRILQKVREASY